MKYHLQLIISVIQVKHLTEQLLYNPYMACLLKSFPKSAHANISIEAVSNNYGSIHSPSLEYT